MTDEEIEWDETAQRELRTRIRDQVAGETRLSRDSTEEILNAIRAYPIEEDAPEAAWADLNDFARVELERFRGEHEAEKTSWPEVTDCDRLDAAQAAMQRAGIIFWQAAPCCDTCATAALGERLDLLGERDTELSDRLRGYTFFIDQNLPEELAEGSSISVALAYGWIHATDVERKEYEEQAIAIGHEVVEFLRKAGLPVAWDGDLSKKISVRLNWKRRTTLV